MLAQHSKPEALHDARPVLGNNTPLDKFSRNPALSFKQ